MEKNKYIDTELMDVVQDAGKVDNYRTEMDDLRYFHSEQEQDHRPEMDFNEMELTDIYGS